MELWPVAKLVLKQSVKALGPLVSGGGTGFVGQHLSRLLMKKGYDVVSVSRTAGAGRMTWVWCALKPFN